MRIDIKKMHTWNIVIRTIFMMVTFAFTLFISYKFVIENEQSNLDTKILKVENLKKTYLINKSNIANLKQIQDEVNSLQIVLNKYLKFLPSEIEMPNLVKDTAKAAESNSVRFSTFTPSKDIKEKGTYYVTKPIDATFDVDFYKISGFMQDVASLERIVNIDNFSMESNKKNSSSGSDNNIINNELLKVKMQFRTYIFSKEANK